MIKLSKPYPSIFENPIIEWVDPILFICEYSFCERADNTFCNQCCKYGVDIDQPNIDRIMHYQDGFEKFSGLKLAHCFKSEVYEDSEFPNGTYRRTETKYGRCIFVDPKTGGCLLHSYAYSLNMPYQEIKPLMSSLYPATFDRSTLRLVDHFNDLSCIKGTFKTTVYQHGRLNYQFYFGDDFIEELDALDMEIQNRF